VSGLKRKTEEWDANPEDTGTIAFATDKEKEQLATNPFYRLEHKTEDQKKAVKAIPVLTQLQDISDQLYKDTHSVNKILRDKFREEKKGIQELKDEAKDRGLGIDLLPFSEEDTAVANNLRLRAEQIQLPLKSEKKLQSKTALRRVKIRSSIFGQHSPAQELKLRSLEKRKSLDPSLFRISHSDSSSSSSSSSSCSSSSVQLVEALNVPSVGAKLSHNKSGKLVIGLPTIVKVLPNTPSSDFCTSSTDTPSPSSSSSAGQPLRLIDYDSSGEDA
jgi:hypothetical protein